MLPTQVHSPGELLSRAFAVGLVHQPKTGRELVLRAAVQRDGSALGYAAEALKADGEFMLAARSNKGDV